MKRILKLISILLFPLLSLTSVTQSQSLVNFYYGLLSQRKQVVVEGTNFRGVWGFGNLNNTNDLITLGSTWIGYHLTYPWSSIETSPNVFDWSGLDSRIEAIIASGKYVSVQLQFGPDCPGWVFDSVGFYTTHGGNDDGPYPKYYDPKYSVYYYRMFDMAAQHFADYPELVAWQIAEGSTGDQEPHKGDVDAPYLSDPYVPQNSEFATTWQLGFRRSAWDTAFYYINLYCPQVRIQINTGNDHEDNTYVYERFGSGSWIKEGKLSHFYIFLGQNLYADLPNQVSRGEVQGDIFGSLHKKKDAWQLVVSAVSLGLGILNTPPGWYNQMIGTTDKRYDNFFNKYANDTLASTSRHGFIQLAQTISIDDTENWPENIYGKLITNQASYNAQVQAIIDDPTIGESYKPYLIMQKTRGFTRSQRVDSLRLYSGLNTSYDLTSNYNTNDVDWDNDYVYSGVNNYEKFVKQNNPFATSVPEYRIGSDTTIYGRFCRSFKISAGAGSMSFDIDNQLAGGILIGDVVLEVVYYDNGTGSWSIQADIGTGMVNVATNTNTNTGKFLKKTVTVNNMKLGTSEDFKLRYTSGANTIFSMVEVDIQ